MEKNLKILRVIDSMDPTGGGPCQGIRNSIPTQAQLGAYNEVVSLDSQEAGFLGDDSFVIHAIGPAKGPWGYASNLIPWLLKNIRRFDVVIIHGLWQYYSYATQKAFRQFHKLNTQQVDENIPKLFVMPHGMLDPYFQKAPDRKLKAIRNWWYWKLVEERVINRSDGLLFTCEAELLLARETFRPYRPKKELNIGYGISSPPEENEKMTEAFFNTCSGLSKNAPYLLFISRIHPKKGVDLLLEAYAQVYDEHMPKLVIAGPGMETPYGQKLKHRVDTGADLADAVFFTGMLTGSAKWGAFYNCDAFVLPSHQENFGIAIVEALACAKPVLISNQVNIWKEIEMDKAGLIASDTTAGATSLLQQWLNLNTEKKQEMGKNAKNLFEHKFTTNAASSLFLKTITNTLA